MAISDQLDVWLDDPSFGPLQQIGTLSRGERGGIPASEQHDAAHLFAC
jgi:hypothetical protein